MPPGPSSARRPLGVDSIRLPGKRAAPAVKRPLGNSFVSAQSELEADPTVSKTQGWTASAGARANETRT
jgi:hypothetical protein